MQSLGAGVNVKVSGNAYQSRVVRLTTEGTGGVVVVELEATVALKAGQPAVLVLPR